jgi:hypothetical protein
MYKTSPLGISAVMARPGDPPVSPLHVVPLIVQLRFGLAWITHWFPLQ